MKASSRISVDVLVILHKMKDDISLDYLFPAVYKRQTKCINLPRTKTPQSLPHHK